MRSRRTKDFVKPSCRWLTSLASSARETLEFQVPSLANSQTKARVRFTEPAISSETLTLTIVAEFDNAEHRFRPGMFAWAALPTARPRAALMAPASAIVNHEQAKYVFVAGKEGTFHAVAVTTGAQSGDWIEVVVRGGPADQKFWVFRTLLRQETP